MKKILIVDDDWKSVAALEIRLKHAGYEVLTAQDGLSGLKQAVEHRPDLVVMDVWMPDGPGIVTAQRFKHVGLANVPVVFLTAGRKKDLWPVAEEVDPAAFFEKPFDARRIVQSISSILGLTGTHAEAAVAAA